MLETTVCVLIAIAILILLALFVPCMESLARLLRRDGDNRTAVSEERSDQTCKRYVA